MQAIYMGICAGAAGAGLLLGIGSFLYYRRQLARFSQILGILEKGGKPGEWEDRETLESKLISRLCRILERSRKQVELVGKEKQEIGELLSDISHQLKTPLANILLNTDILREGNLSSREMEEFLLRSQEQAGKMQWLMKTLVKASRLEQGSLVFDTFPASLTETLARSINGVYSLAKARDISVETGEIQECAPWHNPKWTAEAIGNILENAVKYSPKGSSILIETVVMELYVQVKISDQGPGIPKEEYNKIFKRFYRGAYTEQEEGSGLGLYLAQVILQSEKGYITVSPGKGGGSCFSVFLLLNDR